MVFQKKQLTFEVKTDIIEVWREPRCDMAAMPTHVNVRRAPERGTKKGSTNFRRKPERGKRKGLKMEPPLAGGFIMGDAL